MYPPAAACRPAAAGFFAGLPPLNTPHRTFDDNACRGATDGGCLALTDIVGSTQAIAA